MHTMLVYPICKTNVIKFKGKDKLQCNNCGKVQHPAFINPESTQKNVRVKLYCRPSEPNEHLQNIPPAAIAYTFFSAHGTFFRLNHTLCQKKKSLNKLNNTKII